MWIATFVEVSDRNTAQNFFAKKKALSKDDEAPTKQDFRTNQNVLND